VGRPYVKRYRIYLRPGVRPAGLISWVGLVTEQSQAGEELRLLALMVVLLCLTAWGFSHRWGGEGGGGSTGRGVSGRSGKRFGKSGI